MVINTDQKTIVHFVADGEVKEYNFNFKIFEAGDIDVYFDDKLTETGYNVSINDDIGGKVVFSNPPTTGTRITLIRNLDIKRTSDFQEGGAFRAKVINYELDYQVASLQQLDEKVSRALSFPPYGQENVNVTLPAPSSGKALVWNQNADALINSSINIDNTIGEINNLIDVAEQKVQNAAACVEQAKDQVELAQGKVDLAHEQVLLAQEQVGFAQDKVELAQEQVELAQGKVDLAQDKVNLAQNYANQAYQHTLTCNDKLEETKQYLNLANQAYEKAQQEADRALGYATGASYGNVGDIKYTSRLDVPNGGVWCDGATYTKSQFPDVYQMLVDGKIANQNFSTWQSTYNSLGFNGYFALDTANQKFKVPSIKDVYIKNWGANNTTTGSGDAGSGWLETLPNISGTAQAAKLGTNQNMSASGCLSFVQTSIVSETGNSDQNGKALQLKMNASASSSVYKDGAKVNPSHVCYRAYVVLYSASVEASVSQTAEFLQLVSELRDDLSSKADADLSNISSSVDYIVQQGETNGVSWQKWKSGKLIQRGITGAAKGSTERTIVFAKPYANTNYFVLPYARNLASTNCYSNMFIPITLSTTQFTTKANASETSLVCQWIAIGQGA